MITYLVTSLSPPIIVLHDSLGHSISSSNPADLLDFLLHSCPSRPSSELRAFWDLDSSIASILSLLPEPVRTSLSSAHKATWGSYRLFYVSGKLFCLSGQGAEVTFYDLSQYFPDELPPSSIAGVQSRSEELLSMLAELGISSPTKLTSPVAVAEASGLLGEYKATIPTIFSAPESVWEAYEFALQCTPREWVSAYQVGCWREGELYDYDLSSAYPAAASRLISLADCSFTKSSTLLLNAYYGFVHGDLYLYPDHPLAFCPPVVVNVDGRLCNPVGYIPTDYYTLDTIRYILNTGMGRFKHHTGWFISPRNGVRPSFPFRDILPWLYSQRSASPLASFFLKRVMNGIIGRLLETRKDSSGSITEYGELYNPIYHAVITSTVKIEVARFIANNNITESELVHIGVDGIKSTKRVDLPSQASRMGEWVCKGSEPTVILSLGRILTPCRPAGGSHYHLLLSYLESHPRLSRYEFSGQVVNLNTLAQEQNRVFPEFPHTGCSLLSAKSQSRAIVL